MLIIGHRGASAEAPENTFASFDLAIAQGADAIECDIRSTKDGILVLMHDPTVDRTTNGKGAISDLTFGQIKALDAGSWFDSRFAGERVPSLDEFLSRYAGRVKTVLEIKVPGTESAVVDLATQHRADAVYVSFDKRSIVAVLELERDSDTGVISTTLDQALIHEATKIGARRLVVLASSVTPQLVAQAHGSGLGIWAWGTRDVAMLTAMQDAGVDGVAVDWPQRARRALSNP